MTAHATFRFLVDTVEIRPGGGRDGALYDRLRANLGIDGPPAKFFGAHPEITEQDVLEAFLTTFEPFARMVDDIYGTCAEAGKKADGGSELEIRYDGSPGALRFDPTNFLEYRKLRQKVRTRGTWPRYHSDFIPGYEYWPQRIGDRPWQNSALVEPPPAADVERLLTRAREVGRLHLEFLDRNDVAELLADDSIRLHGPEPESDYFDSGLRQWRESIATGLQAFEVLSASQILASPGAAEKIQFLQRILNEITLESDGEGWRDVLEEWLRLPYWKKRWQVYQIWVTAICIRAMVRAGARTQSRITLRTGIAPLPVAVLEPDDSRQLELWVEMQLPESLRADIAFVDRHGDEAEFVGCIECKQRKDDSLAAMVEDVAEKYVPHLVEDMPLLLVNYDAFATPHASHSRVIAADHVFPLGTGSRALAEYLRRLVPESDMTYVVVDTTGSMHGILSTIGSVIAGASLTGPMMLVLYGDHKDQYVVKQALVSDDLKAIGAAIEAAEQTNGDDEDEALEDAMRFVREDIDAFARPSCSVIVFTDAAAHPPGACPNALDFDAEVRAIVDAGGRMVFVLCGSATKSSVRIPDLPGIDCMDLDAARGSLSARASAHHRLARMA